MQTLINNAGQVLGITIIHSLWQGLIIYLLWRLFIACLPRLSAQKKYYTALFALFSIATVFIYTFYAETKNYTWQPAQSVSYVPVSTKVNTTSNPPLSLQQNTTMTLPVSAVSFNSGLTHFLPYIAVLYVAGLCINLSLIGLAWHKIRLIKQDLLDANYLQAKVDTFISKFNINSKVRVCFSSLVDVPCVIGYIKPILLLPVTLTTMLSAEEVEAILLHELSHIKNNDYVLNFIQQIISVILFFNPFAQLISRAVSDERENRCDDWVVNVTATPLIYARALVKLEETRHQEIKLALAASGKKYHLRTRIERILKPRKPAQSLQHWLLVILCACSLMLWFSFKTTSKTAFNLSGTLSGKPEIVSLMYVNEFGEQVTEKHAVTNGYFNFKGNISSPRLVFLTAYKHNSQSAYTTFFISPGAIKASGNYDDIEHLKIEGSADQAEYQKYQAQTAGVIHNSDILIAEYKRLKNQKQLARKNNDEKEVDRLEQQINIVQDKLMPYRNRLEENTHQYIAAHTNSYVSALQLMLYAKGWSVNTVKTLFSNFDPAIKNSLYGDKIRHIILEMEGDAPGKQAPDFTAKDINNNPIALNAFEGKVTLLNFWTTTQPGLDNAPNLIKIFKKYHPDGFDIIGIADDGATQPETWRRSIKANGTHLWHHVLNSTTYNINKTNANSPISSLYDVSVLPTRILIGRDGTIIGRYVGTDGDAELNKKLASLFD